MNNDKNNPDEVDPELLEMMNSACDPDSPEFGQLLQFWDKFGATGMLEMNRATEECPIDALIAQANCGSCPPKMLYEIITALGTSEVYLIYYNDNNKICVAKVPGAGLIVMVFTRESHANKFTSELFITILPRVYFSMHINPEEGGGMFEIVISQDMVNFLYNISFHDPEALERFIASTGKTPDQIRYQ